MLQVADAAVIDPVEQALIMAEDKAEWHMLHVLELLSICVVSVLALMLNSRVMPGKHELLQKAYQRLLAQTVVAGRALVVWSSRLAVGPHTALFSAVLCAALGDSLEAQLALGVGTRWSFAA